MNRKPIFDAVRRVLGRKFRQSEVEEIDDAIDEAISANDDDIYHDRVPGVQSRRIGPGGLQLIKQFEGFAEVRPDGMVEAYPDPGPGGHPWTIGWGSTGPGIGPDTVWTSAQADARFEADLTRYAAEVAEAVGDCPTSQTQFDALVSFHYNTGAIKRATLTRLHCAGQFDDAAQEFDRWKYAGGRVLRGLVKRRTAEKRLYRA